ncbi:MAG: hypothetical protein Q8L65_02260 [Burkholderiales bacterium]|nr:hypothetical protein [Burkholderiales bacterium]MDP2398801.1 hypothetical protein [Burkholderiales bacterium]MDP3716025.1 hypothetical protein [Burkholderiales bacterium]
MAPGGERTDHAWHLILGLTLWFAWFCATYGGMAVACAVAPPLAALGPLNWLNATVLILATATTAAFATGAWASTRTARHLPAGSAVARSRFIARASAALYTTAAVSTAVIALPAVVLAPCT